MAKVITQLDANKFYGMLSSIHDKTKDLKKIGNDLNLPLYVHRIKDIQRVFEEIIGRATTNLPATIDIKNRIDTLIAEHDLSKYGYFLQQTRKNCNEARHYETNHIMKEEEQYIMCIKSTATLIWKLSEIEVLDSIRVIYGGNAPFHKTTTAEKIVPEKPKYVKSQPVKIELTEEEKEIQDYPNVRLPIVILLDESNSMGYEAKRIENINIGLQLLGRSLYDNEHTRNLVELSIITFGNEVKEILKFTRLENQIEQIKNIKIEDVGDETKIGEAVETALSILERRKKLIRDNAGSYYQPWLFIISDSDGRGIDDYKEVAAKACELEAQKKPKLTIFPVLVGNGDWDILKEFSNKREPYKLSESDFELFFYWIFKEAKYVSMSQDPSKTPARNIDLNKERNKFKEIRR